MHESLNNPYFFYRESLVACQSSTHYNIRPHPESSQSVLFSELSWCLNSIAFLFFFPVKTMLDGEFNSQVWYQANIQNIPHHKSWILFLASDFTDKGNSSSKHSSKYISLTILGWCRTPSGQPKSKWSTGTAYDWWSYAKILTVYHSSRSYTAKQGVLLAQRLCLGTRRLSCWVWSVHERNL